METDESCEPELRCAGYTSTPESFETPDGVPADGERNGSEYPKAAVDPAPSKWNSAHVAGDKRQREDSRTGDEAEGDEPFITHRIDVRPDERDGDHQVRKRQPVCSVGEERVHDIGSGYGSADTLDPREQVYRRRNRLNWP